MAEVLAKSVAGLTARDVLEAYYAIPGWQRRRMCWVMSSQTADALWVLFREAHETSVPLASRPGGDFTLVGRPVRIDEGAEGLAYGQLDG